MGKKATLTRKQYKSIKKMDHNDMETWVASIYESGYNDGRNSVPGIDFEEQQLLSNHWMASWRKKLS